MHFILTRTVELPHDTNSVAFISPALNQAFPPLKKEELRGKGTGRSVFSSLCHHFQVHQKALLLRQCKCCEWDSTLLPIPSLLMCMLHCPMGLYLQNTFQRKND